MKIKLDFDNKKIEVEGGVKIGELIKKLRGLNIDIDEWTLETNTVISYNYNPYYPYYPYCNPPYTYTIDCTTGTCSTTNTTGTHTLEI